MNRLSLLSAAIAILVPALACGRMFRPPLDQTGILLWEMTEILIGKRLSRYLGHSYLLKERSRHG